jgi:Xaa-Pro aminopeptidase
MQKKAALRKKLNRQGADGILITDLKNVRYLSGFTGSSGYIVLTGNQAVFITDFRYREQARIETKGFAIHIARAERPETIKRIVRKYRIRKLGFEDHSVSYRMYMNLLKEKINLKPMKNPVGELRITKSPHEIAYIKTAVQRAENAFRKLRPYIRVGTTEQKLARTFEGLLKKEGCKTLPFGVIVASGHMSALPHAQPTSRVIKKGDIVLFDWGGECEGYFSDMTRVVSIKGRHLKKQMDIYSTVLEAQERAIKSVRQGVRAADIDAAARHHIKEKGYEKYFGHGTGHGVGLEVHEKPVISLQNKNRVGIGMVFTIEPGIYLPGFGGVRIEDIVAVTGKGAEVLTSLPKKIRIIEG